MFFEFFPRAPLCIKNELPYGECIYVKFPVAGTHLKCVSLCHTKCLTTVRKRVLSIQGYININRKAHVTQLCQFGNETFPVYYMVMVASFE